MGDIELLSNENNQPISNNQIRTFFNCYLIKHIQNTFDKFKDYKNIQEIIRSACNVFFNVFWIDFYSSFNIFHALSRAEKSIVLYSEFILLSNNSTLIVNENYRPTVTDAVIFSYKKTVDHFKVDDILNDCRKKDILNCSYFFKEIVILVFANPIDQTQKNTIIEQLNKNSYSFETSDGRKWFEQFVYKHQL